MSRPLHKGIERYLNASQTLKGKQTLIIDQNRVVVSAKNSAFPSLAENVAVRVMLQDIDRAAANYSSTISKDAMQ